MNAVGSGNAGPMRSLTNWGVAVIDAYSFGRIVINGREYGSDVIIYPDSRVQDSWWRHSGHALCFQDISELADSGPSLIIAGTGAMGVMTPDPQLVGDLESRGIEFRALPTGRAVSLYNEVCGARQTGACLHLTC